MSNTAYRIIYEDGKTTYREYTAKEALELTPEERNGKWFCPGVLTESKCPAMMTWIDKTLKDGTHVYFFSALKTKHHDNCLFQAEEKEIAIKIKPKMVTKAIEVIYEDILAKEEKRKTAREMQTKETGIIRTIKDSLQISLKSTLEDITPTFQDNKLDNALNKIPNLVEDVGKTKTDETCGVYDSFCKSLSDTIITDLNIDDTINNKDKITETIKATLSGYESNLLNLASPNLPSSTSSNEGTKKDFIPIYSYIPSDIKTLHEYYRLAASTPNEIAPESNRKNKDTILFSENIFDVKLLEKQFTDTSIALVTNFIQDESIANISKNLITKLQERTGKHYYSFMQKDAFEGPGRLNDGQMAKYIYFLFYSEKKEYLEPLKGTKNKNKLKLVLADYSDPGFVQPKRGDTKSYRVVLAEIYSSKQIEDLSQQDARDIIDREDNINSYISNYSI